MISKSEEITDILTSRAITEGRYRQGQVLKFNYEGSITTLRITKVNKKSGRAWATEVQLYSEDQVNIVEADQ